MIDKLLKIATKGTIFDLRRGIAQELKLVSITTKTEQELAMLLALLLDKLEDIAG